MIAEDNPSEQKIYRKALLLEGYKLIEAKNGDGILSELKTTPVDLLITDLNMGPMSGLDALSIIKQKYPALPVIVVSGHYSGMVDNFNGKAIKVEAFIQKPFSMRILKEKICEILKIDKSDRKDTQISTP